MRKIISLLLLAYGITSVAQEIKPASGSVQRIDNLLSKYIQLRAIDVWLPEGYSATEKYAVLYMQDGQALFDGTATWNKQEWQADETAAKLMVENKTQKFIIVGISSIAKIRHSDYFPQKPFESLSRKQQDSLYLSGKQTGMLATPVNSDNYLKFLVYELKPYIDRNFSVKSDQANTFIAGSSMGALISLYALCEYPNIFGGAACLSTHWPGVLQTVNNPIPTTFMEYLKQKLPSPKNHKIYFDYGSVTLDANYKPYQLRADALLKAKGFTEKSWITKEFPGADHSEKSWAARLDSPFLFLFGR